MISELWSAKCAEDPRLVNNPGARRSLTCKLFGELGSEEKQPYRQKARDYNRNVLEQPVSTEEDRQV